MSGSRRMLAVDLIEFATAALYTGEQQPMGARHSTGFLTSLHCTQAMLSESEKQVILSRMGEQLRYKRGFLWRFCSEHCDKIRL